MRVTWPIAVDSDYGVWRTFNNHFWPAVYVADTNGKLRYTHFGEGEYAMTEMVIQQLLIDAGKEGWDPGLVTVDPQGTELLGQLERRPIARVLPRLRTVGRV